VKLVPHLGHFTFLPTGKGLAGFSIVSQPGQLILDTAMVVRLDELTYGSG
jgi:hypothetical protein